jgi:hypothetical protein
MPKSGEKHPRHNFDDERQLTLHSVAAAALKPEIEAIEAERRGHLERMIDILSLHQTSPVWLKGKADTLEFKGGGIHPQSNPYPFEAAAFTVKDINFRRSAFGEVPEHIVKLLPVIVDNIVAVHAPVALLYGATPEEIAGTEALQNSPKL